MRDNNHLTIFLGGNIMNETKNWMIEVIATEIIFMLSIYVLIDNIIGGFKFFIIGYLLKEVIMWLIRRIDKLWEEL